MNKISFVRKKVEGGPGYPYSGIMYRRRGDAKFARLQLGYPTIYRAMSPWLRNLGVDYRDRLVDAAEAVIDGKIWVNDLMGDHIVGTAYSNQNNGVEYFIREFESGLLTCDCEGFGHLSPVSLSANLSQPLCVHILAFIINRELSK